MQAADDPCVLGSLLTSRVWTLCPSGRNNRESQRERKNCHEIGLGSSRVRKPLKADPICRDLYQSCRVVSTRPRNLTHKRQTEWSDWPRLTQISHCPRVPVDQICFVSHGDASGGSTRAEQAQAGYVIMFADSALLLGMAALVTLVSLEISPCQTCCSQCFCSRGRGFV